MAESTNTSDEASKKKANVGVEKPVENKVSSPEVKDVSPTQETQNMETHAHHLHHAPGKKLWHYFYEFLMLFLAVFCGFLAENQKRAHGRAPARKAIYEVNARRSEIRYR